MSEAVSGQPQKKSKWSLVGKDPYAMPIEQIDLSHPGIWQANEYLPFMERLRKEEPVHYCPESAVGPYWSVMKYADIMQVDTSPQIYSSEPTIGIVDTFRNIHFPLSYRWTPLSMMNSAVSFRVLSLPLILKISKG